VFIRERNLCECRHKRNRLGFASMQRCFFRQLLLRCLFEPPSLLTFTVASEPLRPEHCGQFRDRVHSTIDRWEDGPSLPIQGQRRRRQCDTLKCQRHYLGWKQLVAACSYERRGCRSNVFDSHRGYSPVLQLRPESGSLDLHVWQQHFLE
jgi:hypothetical protein